jgi:predicted small lipoprotein YifL
MKGTAKHLPAALLLLALAACGGSTSAPPSPQSADEVTRTVEQNGKFIELVGPRRQHDPPFLGVPGTNYSLLRSLIDTRSGDTVHQLYVEDSYFGTKREWNAAHGPAGAELHFVPVSLNQISCDNGCSYAEEFGADLPESLLRASPQGLTVGFTAKSGAKLTIAVPGELIQKQLAAADRAHASLPKTAAVAPPAPPPLASPLPR